MDSGSLALLWCSLFFHIFDVIFWCFMMFWLEQGSGPRHVESGEIPLIQALPLKDYQRPLTWFIWSLSRPLNASQGLFNAFHGYRAYLRSCRSFLRPLPAKASYALSKAFPGPYEVSLGLSEVSKASPGQSEESHGLSEASPGLSEAYLKPFRAYLGG